MHPALLPTAPSAPVPRAAERRAAAAATGGRVVERTLHAPNGERVPLQRAALVFERLRAMPARARRALCGAEDGALFWNAVHACGGLDAFERCCADDAALPAPPTPRPVYGGGGGQLRSRHRLSLQRRSSTSALRALVRTARASNTPYATLFRRRCR
jgi:hypothetical protein